MPSTMTPNMSLIVPVPGQETGPQWATDLNNDLSILDAHNHAPGSGIQITPPGLNINSDLSFQSTNAYQLRSVRLNNNGSTLIGASDIGCVYASGGNLYYNNSAGTAVQITSGSSVNAGAGSITGLPSGTASVTFSAGVYVFQSATSTPATVDMGSVILRNTTASSKGMTISPPNALAADASVVMPNIPASTSYLLMDNSGNISTTASSTVQAQLVPSGAILPFGGASAPTGYLLCDGSSVLRATYATLFTAIGTAYGTADGTHFNLPDLRGQFLRGVTGASGNDPNAAARTALNAGGNTGNNVGSFQSAATAVNGLGLSDPGHNHQIVDKDTPGTFCAQLHNSGTGATVATSTVSGNTTGITLSTTDSETRPVNVYVNYIIKT